MNARFDVEKFLDGTGVYHLMSVEKLAFHDALYRDIYVDGKNHEIVYFHAVSRNEYLRITIPFETGEIKLRYNHHYKNEKAFINLEAIDKLINAAAEFMAVCAEHGYLIYKEEDE